MMSFLKREMEILDFIYKNLHSPAADMIMRFVSRITNYGALWIAIGAIFSAVSASRFFSDKTRKTFRSGAIYLAFALLYGLILGNLILKPLIGRVRPFINNSAIKLLIAAPDDFSFPSGHTMSSFAAATAIFCMHNKAGIAAYIFAAIVGFSRLYLYVHYPTDVIFGAVAGVLFGIAGVKTAKCSKLI